MVFHCGVARVVAAPVEGWRADAPDAKPAILLVALLPNATPMKGSIGVKHYRIRIKRCPASGRSGPVSSSHINSSGSSLRYRKDLYAVFEGNGISANGSLSPLKSKFNFVHEMKNGKLNSIRHNGCAKQRFHR